ncbi:MAG: hypothetical protein AMXMBFR33_69220 [Candidatus Xenobia bacterium]
MRIGWLLLALLAWSCGLPLETVQAELRHVRLELSPTPDLRESFRLELWPDPPGALCEGRIALGSEVVRLHRRLTEEEFAALVRSLDREGAAALEDGDSGAQEDQVLYTRLEVDFQGKTRVSRWRGLPPPQARVADALLSSALGPTLRQGLQAVQQRKAELNRSPSPGARPPGPR